MKPSRGARFRAWLGRNKVAIFIGAPLLFFLLAPFPLGCGWIYEIEDELSGHPQRLHGNHPQDFVGLWVRDEYIEYDFVGRAFYLLPNGRFAGNGGMTQRQWHADGDRLFIDSVSLCGNCYQGNYTSVHSVEFRGPDQMLVADLTNKNAKRGIMGTYRRIELTDAYKKEMERLSESEDDDERVRILDVTCDPAVRGVVEVESVTGAQTSVCSQPRLATSDWRLVFGLNVARTSV